MKKLEGKIAVVTGGNSGIGLATAKLFRQEGAKVAISGRDQDTLGSAKKEIGGDTLAINVKGVFLTIQKALPHLNDGASIVLNTTFLNEAGTPGTSVYSASKAAVRSLARTAAAELVGRGIRVNAVSPGPIVTPIYGRLGLPKEAVDAMASSILATVPMKRFGQPEEIAKTVLFLASPDASYITGVEVNVDGEWGRFNPAP